MERRVTAELLDTLPPDDPRAMRSRRDIRRINAWMGHHRLMAQALRPAFVRHLSFRLVDIGAGDGEFLLDVAGRLRGRWRGLDATLVDAQDLLRPDTLSQFQEARWRVRSLQKDVFRWLTDSPDDNVEVIVANLFLHHFDEPRLRRLLSGVAGKAAVFIALEPRRSPLSLMLSRCLWMIGCNAVTRHDATVSVRAGFAGRELSALWPDRENWDLAERRAGMASHVFIARRHVPVAPSIFQPIVSAVFQRQDPVTASHPVPAAPVAGGGEPANRRMGGPAE